jgi:hypothetical protein
MAWTMQRKEKTMTKSEPGGALPQEMDENRETEPREIIETIDEYLDRLRQELAGVDRATIQDALADAEEHLYSAKADIVERSPNAGEAEATQQAIREYGSPVEIAQAYRDIEERLSPALARQERPGPPKRSALARFFGVYADPRAWGALLYMLLSLVTGSLYFSWATAGLATSLGVMVLIIGAPFTILFLLSIRGIAFVEGRLVEALLGVRMPRRASYVRSDAGWLERLKPLLLGKRTWLGMLYMVVQLPLGVIYFTLFITLIALSLSLVAAPIVQEVFGMPIIMLDDQLYWVPAWGVPLAVVAALLLLTSTMHLARWIGWLHGRWAKLMLVRAHPDHA